MKWRHSPIFTSCQRASRDLAGGEVIDSCHISLWWHSCLAELSPPPKKHGHRNTKQLGSSPPKVARQYLGKIQTITTEIRGWLNSYSPPTTQTAKALLPLSNLHSTGTSGFLHRSTSLFCPEWNLKSALLQGRNVVFLVMNFPRIWLSKSSLKETRWFAAKYCITPSV